MAQERTRLNLELPATVRRRLEKLRERTDATSLTEVIRRALAVYDMLFEDYADESGCFYVSDPDDGSMTRVKL